MLTVYNYTCTKPGCVSQSHLVDFIFEAQDFGEGIKDIDGEAFVPFWLP